MGMLAYWLTWSNLRTAARNRRVQIDRQMPFVLDLLSLTMGAGASFLQSCETAVEGTVRGPLQEELAQMLHEVRAGTPLREALWNMAKRTDSEEVGIFVGAVTQGEELGTPLTQIFETQSGMNRFRRTKAAEQAAAKIPNRMAVPTTLLCSVLMLLFGPIIVKAVRGGCSDGDARRVLPPDAAHPGPWAPDASRTWCATRT
jgi:tight adherence protein C